MDAETMGVEDVKVGRTYRVEISDCCVPKVEFTSKVVEIIANGEGEYGDHDARFENGVVIHEIDRFAGGVRVSEVDGG